MSLKMLALQEKLTAQETKQDELQNRVDYLNREVTKLTSENYKLLNEYQQLRDEYGRLQEIYGLGSRAPGPGAGCPSGSEDKQLATTAKVQMSERELENLERDNDKRRRDLVDNRLYELERLHNSHKETLKQLEKLRLELELHLPEAILLERKLTGDKAALEGGSSTVSTSATTGGSGKTAGTRETITGNAGNEDNLTAPSPSKKPRVNPTGNSKDSKNSIRVYICYRHETSCHLALLLKVFLDENNVSTFLDVASDSNLGTGNYRQLLLEKIDQCTHFVLVISDGSLDGCVNLDDHLNLEIERATQMEKIIIPIFDRVDTHDNNVLWPPYVRNALSQIGVVWIHNYYRGSFQLLLAKLGVNGDH